VLRAGERRNDTSRTRQARSQLRLPLRAPNRPGRPPPFHPASRRAGRSIDSSSSNTKVTATARRHEPGSPAPLSQPLVEPRRAPGAWSVARYPAMSSHRRPTNTIASVQGWILAKGDGPRGHDTPRLLEATTMFPAAASNRQLRSPRPTRLIRGPLVKRLCVNWRLFRALGQRELGRVPALVPLLLAIDGRDKCEQEVSAFANEMVVRPHTG
jgi:hypothetical protein